MDISSFLGGNYLTHVDLPQPSQVWTISKAAPQLVGTDQKECIWFAEFPAKPLGLNTTNLRRVAGLYGVNDNAWIGRQIQVYRSTTTYSGKVVPCVRICGPQQPPPESVYDTDGNPVAPQPPAAPAVQPVASPQQQQPAAAPQPSPWEADQ